MSISFNHAPNQAARAFMEEAFGEARESDSKSFLYNQMLKVDGETLNALANKAQQPVTVALHSEGEIKVLSDGTRYRVTKQGWVKADSDVA